MNAFEQSAGEFATAVQVMKALMECDEVLRSHVNKARAQFSDAAGSADEPYVNFWEYPLFGNINVGKLKTHVGMDALWSKIAVKLVQLAGDPWQDCFLRLQAYSIKYGNCCVPRFWPADPALGAWVHQQRHFKSTQHLKQDRIEALESLHFVWDVRAAQWDEHLASLQDYFDEHGDSAIPSGYPQNPSLANWADRMRSSKSTLRVDRRQRLEALGFRWAVAQPSWDAQYKDLVDFRKRTHSFDGLPPDLLDWAKRQKTELEKFMHGRGSKLTSKRCERLFDVDGLSDIQC